MQLFHFLITSWKSDDFSLRYGDILTFKMTAVRHLGIILPPYETTHEVPVAGRSSLSNVMSIWYTDLIHRYSCLNFFAYLAWNAYSGPQNWGFWGLWTHNCDYSSWIAPKGTSLRKYASFKLSTVKNPLRALTCRRVDRKCDGHTNRHTHTHTHTGKFMLCLCTALDR